MTTLPTINQLYSRILANMNGEMGVSISARKKVALRVQAATLSAELWLFYKVLAKVQKNMLPDTAESISMGGTLERYGLMKLGRYPKLAVAGEYTLQVTGAVGGTIPALTVYKSDDDSASPGFLYMLDNAYVLLANPDTITVRALVAGEESKLAITDTLTSTTPLVGVDRGASVTAITVDPLAAETITEYRVKVMNAYRLEAQGGAVGDFRIWSADVQGVKQVYPYAKAGENNGVNVYIEANQADSTDGFGTPPALMITDVGNAIELNPDTSLPLNERGRRPVGKKIYPLAVTPKAIDIEINGFAGVTAAQQATILSALTVAINNIRPFIAGAEPLSIKNDIIDTNKVNAYIISAVPGAGYASVTLKVSGVTLASYTFLLGNIPYLNTVTYL